MKTLIFIRKIHEYSRDRVFYNENGNECYIIYNGVKFERYIYQIHAECATNISYTPCNQ